MKNWSKLQQLVPGSRTESNESFTVHFVWYSFHFDRKSRRLSRERRLWTRDRSISRDRHCFILLYSNCQNPGVYKTARRGRHALFGFISLQFNLKFQASVCDTMTLYNLIFGWRYITWFLFKKCFLHFNKVGWDSSVFTRISVEQTLKSVVDDDHFRGNKTDGKKKEIRSKPSPYLACPHSVVFSSCSWVCSRIALLFWLSKNDHANRHVSSLAEKVLLKQEWRMVRGGNGQKERSTMKPYVRKTWNYVL